MKVVRVVGYQQNLQLQEAPKPEITNPLDVIVKVGAAGVCRTDIHIIEGVVDLACRITCIGLIV